MLNFLLMVFGVSSLFSAIDSGKILDFWFKGEDVRSKWFMSNQAFDQQIKSLFCEQLESFDDTSEMSIPEDPQEQLALVILLDQFSRNIHRNLPKAFAYDRLAQQIVLKGLGNRCDLKLTPVQRAFYYMPLEHAEDRGLQNHSVNLFRALSDENPSLKGFYTYAAQHKVIIDRFGRYPHRNAILGRTSTDEEIAFLQKPGSGF